jgi:hypothetical protein
MRLIKQRYHSNGSENPTLLFDATGFLLCRQNSGRINVVAERFGGVEFRRPHARPANLRLIGNPVSVISLWPTQTLGRMGATGDFRGMGTMDNWG